MKSLKGKLLEEVSVAVHSAARPVVGRKARRSQGRGAFVGEGQRGALGLAASQRQLVLPEKGVGKVGHLGDCYSPASHTVGRTEANNQVPASAKHPVDRSGRRPVSACRAGVCSGRKVGLSVALGMLTKFFQKTRLVTRTKEYNNCASLLVENHGAQ